MQKKRLVVLGLAALAILFAVAPVRAQEEGGDNKAIAEFIQHPQVLVRALHLTAAQTATLRTLATAARTAIRPIGNEIKDLSEQIRTALESANPDACAVGALLVSRHGKYEDVEALLQGFDDDFSAILTPDQLTRYEALKDRINHPR
ncbi:MAG TPA: periplasmic heavy metal sensor [Thermoanaerobaculia bacterium]|jgi:Spy/CpxP family protein refolding chaperone|nr:periplasmic heavy metal sensor [Thermoanaerobaculia bacterium]